MNSPGRAVESWTLATVEYVLANAGAMAIAYPTVSLASTLAGSPAPALVPLVAFALAFGASYPLVAGDWSIPRLYDVLLVAACCTALATVALAGVAIATNQAPTWTRPGTAARLWVLSLGIASLALSRSDLHVLA